MKKTNIFFIVTIIFILGFANTKAYAEAEFSGGIDFKIPAFETKFAHKKDDTNFGFTFSSGKAFQNYSLNFKMGNLSSSGILSKMKQPSLSGIGTPFSTGYSSPSGISSELPGLSSFSNPLRGFFQLGYNNRKSNIKNITASYFYSPYENQNAGSLYSEFIFFQQKMKLKNSFAFGCVPFQENKSTSWITKDSYYPEDLHFISIFASSLEFWNLAFFLSVFSSESPFGNIDNCYRADLKYQDSNYSLTLSAFYNPNQFVITWSDQKLHESLQARLNLQLKNTIKLNKLLFVKTGFSSYINLSPEETEYPLKFALGSQLKYGTYTFSFSSTINTNIDSSIANSINLTFDSCTLYISNSWTFPNLSAGVNFSTNINPAKDFSYLNSKYTTKLYLNINRNPVIKLYTDFSVSTKNNITTSKKINFGLDLNIKFSYFTSFIKTVID